MSYSTVNSKLHIWLYSIATDKVLVDKQEEIEALQMKMKLLNVELIEKEESGISWLIEMMKGK